MTRRPPGEPLPLAFEAATSRLPDRIPLMRPTWGQGPFDDPGTYFEPWWPGIRVLVLVEDGTVRLRAEAIADPTPAFPELDGIPALVRRDGVVLDATLMVLDEQGRPSRDLLERRMCGGSGGSAALVASDLLFLDGASLARRPFGERRGELAALLAPSPWCLAGRGFVGDGTIVATALGALGFRALSARRLDAPLRAGPAGTAWYRVPVVAAPRELPPLLAVFRRLPL